MRSTLVTPFVVAALALSACGGYGDDSPSGDRPGPGGEAAAAGEAAGAALVGTGPSPLGEVLTTGDGRTLYGRTGDEGGVPTCAGDCAEAWPPVLVDGPGLPEGLDPEVYSVVRRADGTHQLAAGGWPLYSFAADAEPGDVGGQGSGDVWFAVAPGGRLLRDAAPEPDPAPAPEAPAGDGSDPASDDGY